MNVNVYTYAALVKRVIDGDTLVVDIDLGFNTVMHDQVLRLAKLNAPELNPKSPPTKGSLCVGAVVKNGGRELKVVSFGHNSTGYVDLVCTDPEGQQVKLPSLEGCEVAEDTLSLWLKSPGHRAKVALLEALGVQVTGSGTVSFRMNAKGQVGAEVVLETVKDRTDKYGRYLAVLWVKSGDDYLNVNEHLINSGHAVRVKELDEQPPQKPE